MARITINADEMQEILDARRKADSIADSAEGDLFQEEQVARATWDQVKVWRERVKELEKSYKEAAEAAKAEPSLAHLVAPMDAVLSLARADMERAELMDQEVVERKRLKGDSSRRANAVVRALSAFIDSCDVYEHETAAAALVGPEVDETW